MVIHIDGIDQSRATCRMRPANHIRAARRVQPQMGKNVHFQLYFTYNI